ncbi:sugar phosphate isomerase/epimerase family protein [Flexithrix dorotheae]|uniref:sugar phosphate isomerase/epimerase family protein n=1 Tax=Flexithrix dorotheae TaxID=70993 RepID=UPI00035D801C|nr:TIM barrel protein [Flexithrix dorotheae]
MKLKIKLITFIFFTFSLIVNAQKKSIENPFFSFNTGIKSGGYETLEEQAKLLKDLGYDGVEKEGIDGFSAMQKAIENEGLNIYTNYIRVDLDNEPQPYDPRIEEIFKMVEGKPTMIWLHVVSKKYKPSSVENDGIAVPILQEIADMAAQYNAKVMLYPHVYFWIECAEDAIRVAEKVNRRNLGMTFNLCHYLAHCHMKGIDPIQKFPSIANASVPYLFAISFNGADANPADEKQIWKSFIQPLGEGDYDTYNYLKTFLDLGFTGPVGLQTYNIKLNSDIHLKKSMETWQSFKKKYTAGK